MANYWLALTGTVKSAFKIGKTNPSTLDTASLTAARTHTLPDADGTFAMLQVANVFTANQTVSNTSPTLTLTDTTASAKSLTIKTDANLTDIRESSEADGSLLQLDLTGSRVLMGGHFRWDGGRIVAADVDKSSSSTLSNVTGLSVNVAAGKYYAIEAFLDVDISAAGPRGIKVALSGTATMTAIRFNTRMETVSTTPTIHWNAMTTALDSATGVAPTGSFTGLVRITGYCVVNAAGTLTVQHAQNSSGAGTTTVKKGSWLRVIEMQ